MEDLDVARKATRRLRLLSVVALIVVAEIAKPSRSWHTLFWLESVAVVSFGVSWLVKGEFLEVLADP